MGVRGTDFMAVYNPLLDESEIVVFDGTVDLDSRIAPPGRKDHKLIPKGHWGGVGGRYGKKIGDLIHLPANILEHFNQATTVPTTVSSPNE